MLSAKAARDRLMAWGAGLQGMGCRCTKRVYYLDGGHCECVLLHLLPFFNSCAPMAGAHVVVLASPVAVMLLPVSKALQRTQYLVLGSRPVHVPLVLPLLIVQAEAPLKGS